MEAQPHNGAQQGVKKTGIVRRMWATSRGKVVLLIIVVGLVVALSWGLVEATSVPFVCGTCHEIKPSLASWQRSEHYLFENKVRASCRDCHIPGWNEPVNVIYVKVSHGARDIYQHFSNKNAFKDLEWRFALKAKAEITVTDQVCLRCHSNVLEKEQDIITMDDGQKIIGLHTSQEAKKLRCTVCHKHTGHAPHG